MTRSCRAQGVALSPLLLACWLLCGGCASLEPLQESVCGNRVVEVGEECDTHAPEPGAVCLMPIPALASGCVYFCSADGVDGSCPPGYFCNAESRCVAPSGTFAPTGSIIGSAGALLEVPVKGFPTAVVLSEDIGNGRRAASAYEYLDFERGAGFPIEFGAEMVSPTLWRAGAEDLAVEPVSPFVQTPLAFVGEHGIQALKHPEDYAQSLLTIALPAETAARAPRELRVVSVVGSAGARALDGAESLLQLEDSGEALLFRRLDQPEPPLLDLSWTGKRLSDLQGSVLVGDWDVRPESPCHEVVVPLRGLKYLLAFSPCTASGWFPGEPQVTKINLPSAAGAAHFVAGPARAIDVDLDGRLDVVFASSAGPYVAFGSGAGTFFSSPGGKGKPSLAAPLVLEFSDASRNEALPLDAADLNADGHIDYVLPGGIALSQQGDGKLFWAYRSTGWVEAKIDRQGSRVIASSLQSGLEVLTYLASAEQFVRNRWATALPAAHLALGDYDGDAATDVAFVQSTSYAASVWAVLGGARRSGLPEKLADLAAVSELQPAYLDTPAAGPDAIGDLIVSGRLPGRDGETFSFLFGSGNGRFASPLVLRHEDGRREIPLSVAASAHATSPHFLAAAAIEPGPSAQPVRLWAFNPNGELGPRSLVQSEPLSDLVLGNIGGSETQLAASDLDGDGVSDLVLVAPYASSEERSGLVVGRLDGDGIQTVQPLVFDGVVDALARLRVADLDGDGWNDILFRPSGAEAPPLLVFWNDGSGQFSKEASATLRVAGGVNDFTCDAFSGSACALLVAAPSDVFAVEARDRKLRPRALSGVAGGRTIGAFNFQDTSSLLVGGDDAIFTYQGGLTRPGLAESETPAP